MPMIIPVRFKADKYEPNLHGEIKKCRANIDEWYLLPVDIDSATTISEAQDIFKDYEYILYTTHRHKRNRIKNKLQHRFRIFILLSNPVTTVDFDNRKQAIQKLIGKADSASLYASQGFFMPSYSERNAKHTFFHHNTGKPLDLLSLPIDPKPIVIPRNDEVLI